MPICNFCNAPLKDIFIDIGHQPPSNSFLTAEQLELPETYYPLRVYVCKKCFLVQLPEYKKVTEIFNDSYPYYSSQSPSNVSHAKQYVDMVMDRFSIKRVLEIGSNDGYLLQHFPKDVEVCGIDMAKGPIEIARKKGIPGIVGKFGTFFASGLEPYDLICNINTLAHQSNINDFVGGMKMALAPNGIITCEFPHLMNLVEQCQFDTIYHEHRFYFSFATVCEIFHRHELEIFDVDGIPEHGGSLRVYAQHDERLGDRGTFKVFELLNKERKRRINTLSYYENFQSKIEDIRHDINEFLYDKKYLCDTVIGYGAPAKASTFLNYCGIRSDILPYVIDRSPHKQGKFLPGSHIPVVSEDILREVQPKYVLILAWNLKEEIMEQLSYIKEWNGRFVVAMPELEVI